MPTPFYLNFNAKACPWGFDYLREPEHSKVGEGEQGVFICELYKSEMLKNWRFKTLEVARKSAEMLYKLFLSYLETNQFLGADMARKFLQVGFTRARRYRNYKGGRKYDPCDYHVLEKGTGDALKAESPHIFYLKWQEAEHNPLYAYLKKEWKERYG